jgi:hypothetical protein
MIPKHYLVTMKPTYRPAAVSFDIACSQCSDGCVVMLGDHAVSEDMRQIRELAALSSHSCQFPDGLKRDHWMTIMRDAAIDGRDREVIGIVLHESRVVDALRSMLAVVRRLSIPNPGERPRLELNDEIAIRDAIAVSARWP